jgi:hypothetical protein
MTNASDSTTLDAMKDFYLTNLFISSSTGSTNAGTDTITAIINGVSTIIGACSCGAIVTDLANSICLNFNPPIKIDRGTNIISTIYCDSTVLGFYGYYVDTLIYDTGVNKV